MYIHVLKLPMTEKKHFLTLSLSLSLSRKFVYASLCMRVCEHDNTKTHCARKVKVGTWEEGNLGPHREKFCKIIWTKASNGKVAYEFLHIKQS